MGSNFLWANHFFLELIFFLTNSRQPFYLKTTFKIFLSFSESWVELAPSRASLSSSIEAVNIGENSVGGGIISQRDSRLSPVSIQSPAVEFESSLEQVKYRLVKSMIGPDVGGNTNKSSTDWLWEWAYRSDGGASNDKYIF